MAEPQPEERAEPGPLDLRVATGSREVQAAARALDVAPAALATTLVDPALRLLVDDRGGTALLRREWGADGHAEAVLVRCRGARADGPAVLAVAAAWGCERVRDAATDDVVPVPVPPDDAPLADRFLHAAGLAATRAEVAVALARDAGQDTVKFDGSPSLGADEAAHLAAAHALRPLGVTVLSEERSDRSVAADEPWVVLDPLDGTGNFRAGLAPWAFSAALVQDGRPVAGLVADLSSGRRWSGAAGAGAYATGCRCARGTPGPSSRPPRRPGRRCRSRGPRAGSGSPAAPPSTSAWSPTVPRAPGRTSTAAARTCTTSPAGSPCWRRPAGWR